MIKEKTYNTLPISNKILQLASQRNLSLSKMKLNKLCYLVHGAHLAITEDLLFNEPVEAWRHGPMFPSLFHGLGKDGAKPLSFPITKTVIQLSELQNQIVARILNDFGNKEAFQLSDILQEKDGPWFETYQKSGNFSIISNELIKMYYKDKMV